MNNPQMAEQLLQNNPFMPAATTTPTTGVNNTAGTATNTTNLQATLNSVSHNMQNPLFQRIITDPQAMQVYVTFRIFIRIHCLLF